MRRVQPDLSAFGRSEWGMGLGQTGESSAMQPVAAPPPEEYVLAPDPVLMAEQASRMRMMMIVKYLGLAALGGLSGWAVAGKMDRSQAIGATIGGIAVPGIAFFLELLLTGIKVSKELPPITSQ